MSFGFRVVKDDEGIKVENAEEVAKYIPNGVFTVNGHKPLPGTSQAVNLSVQWVDHNNRFVASVNSGASVDPEIVSK